MTLYQQLCVDFFSLVASLGTAIPPSAAGELIAVMEDIAALAPPPPATSIPAVKPGGAAIPQAKH